MANQETLNGIFDISEKPIQEWITKQINSELRVNEIFSSPVYNVRKLYMNNVQLGVHYFIELVCTTTAYIQSEQRTEDVKVLQSFPMEFGNILNAYNTSIDIVYKATMKAEDFECEDSKYEQLQPVTFTFDNPTFSWKAQDFKSDDVLCLRVTPMDDKSVSKLIGLHSSIKMDEPIANIDALYDHDDDEDDDSDSSHENNDANDDNDEDK